MTHTSTYRVYYEDTDAGGVVYYANYLKFAERARTELLRNAGVNQSALATEQDVLFVVRKAALDLCAPARLDDEVVVKTSVLKFGGASMTMQQAMHVGEVHIATIDVVVACINSAFKPQKLPAEIKQTLGG